MNSAELEETIARMQKQKSDDSTVEAKAAAGGLPEDMWPTVSAFANTDGGIILLGIDERTGFVPAKGFDANKVISQWRSGTDSVDGSNAKISPIPESHVERLEYRGAPVVAIEIFPMKGDLVRRRPCYVCKKGLQKGTFIREDDADRKATAYEIYLMQMEHETSDTDVQPVPQAGADDLNEQILKHLFDRLKQSSSHALDNAQTVRDMAARVNVETKAGSPTLTGILATGNYPQQFFPQLSIDVTVHPAISKGQDPQGVRFLDRQVCDGPIPIAVESAVQVVLRNLRVRHVVNGVGAEDIPEIPVDVLREAIVNAVAHRDYSKYARGQQVSVDVYPDRVEISNPGGLWADRTLENIREGKSISRNEALTRLLSILPRSLDSNETVSENQGSGVPRMYASMQFHGLPGPEYHVTLSNVTVILRRFGLLDPAMNLWIDSLPEASSLNMQERMALSICHQDGDVNWRKLKDRLGLDSDDARQLLNSLVSKGLLEMKGEETAIVKAPLPDKSATKHKLSESERAILGIFQTDNPITIHEMSDATGRSLSALRRSVHHLVEIGYLIPTAPSYSRKRAYKLNTSAILD